MPHAGAVSKSLETPHSRPGRLVVASYVRRMSDTANLTTDIPFTIFAIWDDTDQRYTQTVHAPDAQTAEARVRASVACVDDGNFRVAGVIAGRHMPLEGDVRARECPPPPPPAPTGGPGPLYRSEIIIWSHYDPRAEGVDIEPLARDATVGDCYCSRHVTERIAYPPGHPDWDDTEFFGEH